MSKIKLKEWADRHNLSYLTANRHFHAGMIPGAVQLDSGTILVEDDTLEQNMAGNSTNDAMSLFLKKTVEFSKNESSVEDFAAYVISNFQLKLMNSVEPSPRYSRNKPKPEQVQAHFQQFLPDKEKTEQLKAITSLIKQQGHKGEVNFPVEDLSERFIEEPNPFNRVVDTVTNDMSEEFANIGQILAAAAPMNSDVRMYGPETATEGLVSRSVDFNTTPQQINYTGSTSQTFSSSSSVIADGLQVNSSHLVGYPQGGALNGVFLASSVGGASVPFQPTQKELLSVAKVIETSDTADLAETDNLPRKRGRKPSKKR